MAFYLCSVDIIDSDYHADLPKNCQFFLAIEQLELLIDPRQSDQKTGIGSQACRILLQQLQQKFLLTGALDDSKLPYTIQNNADVPKTYEKNSQTWYVSLSHSKQQVAVLIANTRCLGVDIEDKVISSAVARRYFSSDENRWWQTLDTALQATARHLLWVIKESQIKVNGNSGQSSCLVKGLSDSVLPYLKQTFVIKPNQQLLALTDYFEKSLGNAELVPLDFATSKSLLCGYIPYYHCGFLLIPSS